MKSLRAIGDANMHFMEREKGHVVRIVRALYPDAKVYLFGSRARGTNRENSDLDLAVDVGRPLEINEIGQLRALIEILYIPVPIDVVDFQRTTGDFRDRILRDRIEWES